MVEKDKTHLKCTGIVYPGSPHQAVQRLTTREPCKKSQAQLKFCIIKNDASKIITDVRDVVLDQSLSSLLLCWQLQPKRWALPSHVHLLWWILNPCLQFVSSLLSIPMSTSLLAWSGLPKPPPPTHLKAWSSCSILVAPAKQAVKACRWCG